MDGLPADSAVRELLHLQGARQHQQPALCTATIKQCAHSVTPV
jgi:hypothetical protein